MSLAAGARLGPYEVAAAIGAGGMGEVYRARDTKLNRDVALKILPPAFASDPDRLVRFHREAQVLASLNHPHIAAIYGFEDSGDTHALVLEFVDGPTLADRIAQGPIPLEEALPIAAQIAEALEAAHEQGIIHRDLKPANIKLTATGRVKVLDFGLAKLVDVRSPMSASPLSLSPTLTTPLMATGVGMLIGTAAYMSPEQVKGREADRRSDIWAFGCVVYEMLTGTPAFGGEDLAEILGAVMKSEPDWTKLPSDLSPAVRTLLSLCLRKDSARRLRSATDAVLQCEESMASTPGEPIAVSSRRALTRRSVVIATVGVLVGFLIGGVAAWNLRPGETQPVGRFRSMLPEGQRMAGLDLSALAFAPDGRHFVYAATDGGPQQLYLGQMDSLGAKPIAGTEGGESPFFSPDGLWVGFFAEDSIKKVALNGGPPVVLARADNFGRGASWGRDGTIVFAPRFDDGLFTIRDAGGAIRPLTMINRQKNEGSHRFPHFLPGGKALLFTVGTGGSWDDARIEVVKLETGERKVLIQGGSDARYVPTGHIVFVRAGALMAAPFDLDRQEVTGSPVAVIDGLLPSTNNTGSAQLTFSEAGSVLYVPGTLRSSDRALVFIDRSGAEERLPLTPRSFRHPRLSPDGQRVVLDVDEGNNGDVWAYDIARGTLTRVTFDGLGQFPTWSADGGRVTYQTREGNTLNLVSKNADGGGTEEPLTKSDHVQRTGAWSRDGTLFAFTEVDPVTGWDVWIASVKDGRKARPFIQTRFNEANPAFSADTRWIAYQSDESGRNEIYVQPFPGPGSKLLVSTDGGTDPVWSGDGRELFYRNGDRMMVIAMTGEPALRPSKPAVLFAKPSWGRLGTRDYDVTRDGRRFLMVVENEQVAAATHINVVLNWFTELQQRVPTR